MKYSQVRDLARRYATGKLSQENYRNQRRALIDSITGGGVQLAYRSDERAAARKHSNTKLLGLTAVVLVAAGIGVVMLLRHSSQGHAPGSAQAATVAAAIPALPAPGPDLVRSFVETDDWTDGSLRIFEQRWQNLGTDEQAKAKDSPVYGRLLSAVRQQVDSEKAVAGSDVAGDAHLTELQKLAKTLGANSP
ncbi:MAG TPA: hypothetical protein VGM16_08920 [Gammaproteobacteria bacterium]|jgi:hypothetical protein